MGKSLPPTKNKKSTSHPFFFSGIWWNFGGWGLISHISCSKSGQTDGGSNCLFLFRYFVVQILPPKNTKASSTRTWFLYPLYAVFLLFLDEWGVCFGKLEKWGPGWENYSMVSLVSSRLDWIQPLPRMLARTEGLVWDPRYIDIKCRHPGDCCWGGELKVWRCVVLQFFSKVADGLFWSFWLRKHWETKFKLAAAISSLPCLSFGVKVWIWFLIILIYWWWNCFPQAKTLIRWIVWG